MSSKTKKASKPKKAKAAAPKAEETTAPTPAVEGQEATVAPKDVQAPEASKQTRAAPKEEETATLMVLVGPYGQAGRIVLGQAVYDGVTPRRMARKDFDAMRALYDLQEVKDS